MLPLLVLAGGFGTRLAEYTDVIPKPMVTIGGNPILIHIMEHFAQFGVTEFVIATGYKSEVVKRHFVDFATINSDVEVQTRTGEVRRLSTDFQFDWKVTLVDTGLETMTGGRLKRLEPYLGNEDFFMTYGDGIANVNLEDLRELHNSVEESVATVTAVRPAARFGELELDGFRVSSFKEKPQIEQGWINGGFFVLSPSIFDYIAGDSTIFEKDPLERLASEGRLTAFKHSGFWQCMDTKRDRDYLEGLWASGKPPWREVQRH